MGRPPEPVVLWLENVRKDDISRVGGKCANLGELTAKGVHVPPGFAVTADAFRHFLDETKIEDVIHKTLNNSNGSKDPRQYEEASQENRKPIESVPMPTCFPRKLPRTNPELCQVTKA